MEGSGGRRGHPAAHYTRADVARRRRLLRRGLSALAVVALISLAAGLLLGTGPARAEHRAAARYATLWAQGDYARMYAQLDDASRRRVDFQSFAAAYRAAAETATIRAIAVGKVGGRSGNEIPVALTIRTAIFGTLHSVLELPVSGSGDSLRIAWNRRATFPGLRAGEQLSRTTTLPARATLLARDGTVLAAGAARSSQAPDVSAQIVGQLGPAPLAEQGTLRALGYPDGALVGVSGLERALQVELGGTPGGTLLAGGRVLAQTAPKAAPAVRTTLDVGVERAAIAALAGRYGGIAALDPRTGQVLALAGVAYSALQPPGSTFKIVTATGVLESHLATLRSTYPVVSGAAVEGVTIENANGEYCGGTLIQSFAKSCNSVFAPLGAQLGAAKLVDVAQRYGFNEAPAIDGAQTSTIPSSATIGDALAVGSSAIGQGMVQATALQMTTIAATIAMRGRRPLPTLLLGRRPRFVRVTRPAIARQVERMMRAVVQYGTGTAAAIPGAQVAGKTGTAELHDTVKPDPNAPAGATDTPPQPVLPDTDAWFVAYAPAGHPRIAVGALFPEAGAGGDVAAPAARGVLLAGLRRGRRG